MGDTTTSQAPGDAGHISRLEHLNAVLRAVRDVNQLITRESSREKLLQGICDCLTSTRGFFNAWCATLDEAGEYAVRTASSGFDGGFKELRERLARGEFPSCMRTALGCDATVVVTDPPKHCPDCPLSCEYGNRAGLVHRLALRGRVHGVLAVSVPRHYAEDSEEHELLAEAASDLAFALEKLDADESRAAAERETVNILESISDAFFALDEHLVITYYNGAAARVLGRSAEEVVGSNLLDAFPEARGTDFEKKYREVLQTRRAVSFETFFEQSPYRNWYEVRVYPRERGISVYFTVTTERKEAELALRRANDIILRSPAVAFIWRNEPGWPVEYVSDNVERQFGWAVQDFVSGRVPFASIVHPEDMTRVAQEVVQATEGGAAEFTHAPYRIVTRDGKVKWVDDRTTIRRDPGGTAQTYEGILLDITAQHESDLALQREHQMLERAERIAHLGSWEWDVATDTVTWSDELFRVFGRDPAAGAPSFAEHEKFYTPESMQRLRDAVNRAIAEGVPYEMELDAVISDGSIRRCVARGYPEVGLDGQVARLYGSFEDVTERKRAEQLAAEQHELMAYVIRHDPNAIAVYDTGLRYVFVSERYLRDYGVEEQNIIGKHHYEVFPEMPQRWKDVHQRVLAGAVERAEDDHFVRPDGSVTYNRWECRPWYRADGRIGGIITYTEVTTERKLAEQALRESEQRFRSFVENASDIVYALTPEGIFTYISPNWQDLMGEPAEAAIGRSFEPYVHPEDRHLCREFLAQVLGSGRQQISVEYRVVRQDGTMSWHVSKGSALRDAAGNVSSYVGIARDVTEQKAAEERLRASEARYRSLTENFPNGGLFLYDRDFRYLAANGKGFAEAGLAAAEVVGHTVAEIFPELWEFMRPYHEAAQRGEEGYYEVEYGGRLYANQVVPVIDENGPTGHGIVIAQDITEQREAEAHRAKLEQQLQQAQRMEAIGRLAGGVAHDFNNILTAILGNVELAQLGLEQGELETEELQDELQHIEQSAQRAASLTRQLLAFSRRQVTQPQVLDLNRTIGNMEKMLRRLLAEDISFEFVPGHDLMSVRMDPGQVEQIIMNLAVNAGDAMPKGGSLTIETSNVQIDGGYARVHADTQPGAYVRIAVADTGCGMDAETQERIWEPFFTTKAVGQGTGLGLATVYGIVKQVGGHVMVYSEPGHGSTFKIYLPAHREVHAVASSGEQRTPTTSRGTETVVVCEDDTAVRVLTAQVLASAGYHVLEAGSGAEAAELIRRSGRQVGLLITDVVMPDMNGRKLVDKLAELGTAPPTLFVSGYTSNIIAHHGVIDRGIDFLEKPFTRKALLRRVRDILDRER